MKALILTMLMALAAPPASARDTPDGLDVAIDELQAEWQRLRELAERRSETEDGDDRDILKAQMTRRGRSLRKRVRELVELLPADLSSADMAVAKELAIGVLEDIARWARDDIEDRRAVVERRSAEREKRPSDDP